jgi:hypothetical protein
MYQDAQRYTFFSPSLDGRSRGGDLLLDTNAVLTMMAPAGLKSEV